MMRSGFASLVTLAAFASTLSAQPKPQTRAERTNYKETSLHADVIAFVDSLKLMGAPITVQQLGTSPKGRVLPLVIASRPRVSSPAEARRLNRPIAYVQANIHAGEVEGKEAILALLRDWSFDKGKNILDSLVLVVVPIYNADGNDTLGPQRVNRGAQNGPEMIGQRPNGQGLDLNRDYVKAEAPETRASLAAFAAWDPDLFMDLHTTDGSYHGYALTYSPSLHPAAPLGLYTADTLLPEIRRRVKARHNFETFPYGNFTSSNGRESMTATDKSGWWTYEHKQRYGTNYYGLRGRVSILSEAFSHDPLERRVASTRAFVQETLSLLAERAREVRAHIAAANLATTFSTPSKAQVPIAARFDSKPDTQIVLVEQLERASDSTAITEPGMMRGFRRTHHFVETRMPVVDRFEAAITQTPPRGYAIIGGADSLATLLRLHGLRVDKLPAAVTASMQVFVIDSVAQSARPFQGHREATVTGTWKTVSRSLPAGTLIVPMGSHLDLLAMELLEPQSDDGVLTWNAFDAALTKGNEAPVARLLAPLPQSNPRR